MSYILNLHCISQSKGNQERSNQAIARIRNIIECGVQNLEYVSPCTIHIFIEAANWNGFSIKC
jgi:hypothetical protein